MVVHKIDFLQRRVEAGIDDDHHIRVGGNNILQFDASPAIIGT